MSEYSATVHWLRSSDENFIDNQYSRRHEWIFDGGVTVPASSSPHVVPLPYSVESNVDPEEAFIASISSCHMLFFLSIAAKKNIIVDEYTDDAVGVMGKNEAGDMAMLNVILKPAVIYTGDNQPTAELIEKIHHQSHKQCFIANSVKTKVTVDFSV